MSILIDAVSRLSRPNVVRQRDEVRTRTATVWPVLSVLLILAIWLRHILAANTDVSWLITVGERVLDGQRLYVDVIETNPPMAVLAYMPGIVLARLLHLPVETVIDGLVFAALAVSLLICARSLQQSAVMHHLHGGALITIAFIVLAIVPTQAFGQREHLALIGLLPALAVLAMRTSRETPPLWSVIFAAAGLALALCFKPFFAVGIVSGVVAAAIRLRTWRIALAPEYTIAAALVVIYVLAIAVFYPEFFTVIGPLLRDVYFPAGISTAELLAKPATAIWLATVVAVLLPGRAGHIGGAVAALLVSSCGFALVFVVQRKGWPYHSYPALALALLALGLVLSLRRPADNGLGIKRAMAIAMFAGLVAASMLWFDVGFDARSLQESVARLARRSDTGPEILAITAEPGLGHPLVRALDGVWVSRQQGLWVTAYIDYMRQRGQFDVAREAGLAVYANRERAMLAEDIAKHPPSVVLVDNLSGNWSAWLDRHPDIAELLSDYRTVEIVNGIELRVRETSP